MCADGEAPPSVETQQDDEEGKEKEESYAGRRKRARKHGCPNARRLALRPGVLRLT